MILELASGYPQFQQKITKIIAYHLFIKGISFLLKGSDHVAEYVCDQRPHVTVKYVSILGRLGHVVHRTGHVAGRCRWHVVPGPDDGPRLRGNTNKSKLG